MPLPLVSIVTPSLNQGQFIEQTILSVLDQDYPNIEYMVVDGGSTDGTLEILKKYEDRLSWVSEPDAGQSDAINKGWRKAQGEIVAYLNSDDTYCPGAVRKAVEAFLIHPDTGIVYGDCYFIDATGRRIRWMRMPQVDLSSLLCFTIIQQPAVFLRKVVVDEVGYLNTNLHYAMDHEYWIRAAFHFRFLHIPEFLACAREHPAAKSTAYHTRFAADAISILNGIFSDPKRALLVKDLRKKAYAGAYLNGAFWFCLAGESSMARSSVTKAVRLHPLLLMNELTLPVIVQSFVGIPTVRPLRWIKHGWMRMRKRFSDFSKPVTGFGRHDSL